MNNNSKVLALKYRPQTFDDLIGQEVVAETITNAIKADKIPNAYLFTGIRGIGKTTIARIVAKALNCSNGIENKCKIKLIIVMRLQTQIILMYLRWMLRVKQV